MHLGEKGRGQDTEKIKRINWICLPIDGLEVTMQCMTDVTSWNVIFNLCPHDQNEHAMHKAIALLSRLCPCPYTFVHGAGAYISFRTTFHNRIGTKAWLAAKLSDNWIICLDWTSFFNARCTSSYAKTWEHISVFFHFKVKLERQWKPIL